jgi:putative membrane protein
MKLKISLIALSTALFVSAFTLPSFAATSENTQDFIHQATVGNLFEVKSSQLALKRTSDANVRDFANHMIKDHTRVGDRLKSALSAENKKYMPKTLDQENQDKLDNLQKTSAADFNKDFIDAQVEAHDNAVDLFQDYADNGDDQRLKSFAADNLPTLKKHQDQIKELQDKDATIGAR